MRAYVERRWARAELDIYLLEEAGREAWLYVWNGDSWERVPLEESAEPSKPSLRLRPEVLEAIIRAAEGHVHPQDATVRHLDDAVKVRDRLLALVEKGWQGERAE